ncbi:MAG: helix-turn-helix transcriptional regulator [Oscillospiraceae bacterium]|nr:helix-turn-helix transcriptional regulator [Oscillospiraceae bacterium]
MISLGKRIRQARVRAGFTQENVAEIVGVSRTAVTRWEKGEIGPKLDHLAALAVLFGVTADHLLGLEPGCTDALPELTDGAMIALWTFVREVRKENHETKGEDK